MTAAAIDIVTPGPGVYPRATMTDYHRWACASNSRLTHLRRSPAHLKAYLAEPQKETAALAVGRAVHSVILEPDDFDARYCIAEQCTATLKSGKNAGDQCRNPGIGWHADFGWLCGQHSKDVGFDNGRIVLSPDDYKMCVGIRDSVHAHPAARKLLAGDGDNEISLRWDDAESGVASKCRPDRLSPAIAGGCIIDLKTTRDAGVAPFTRDIFSLGYFRKAAWYLDGASALALPAKRFAIIAAEKLPPFAVAVYCLTDGAVEAGREQLRSLLTRYAWCVEHDEWPAYSADVVDVSLPDYAWRQLEDEALRLGVAA